MEQLVSFGPLEVHSEIPDPNMEHLKTGAAIKGAKLDTHVTRSMRRDWMRQMRCLYGVQRLGSAWYHDIVVAGCIPSSDNDGLDGAEPFLHVVQEAAGHLLLD